VYVDDFDDDNNADILIGGNLSKAKPETGIYEGGYGLLLKGFGNGDFEAVPPGSSGVSLTGDIRAFGKIKHGANISILVGKSNEKMEVLNLSK
jgi:hypothetical protein